MTTVKTYALKNKNMTAFFPPSFVDAWKNAQEETGLTNAQSFLVALALFYERPDLWVKDVDTGPEDLPDSPNFHTRVPGVLGTYVEEIQQTIQDKRLARNDLRKVNQTEVIARVMSFWISQVQGGKLMSLGLD